MTMPNRKGVRIDIRCARCGIVFSRPVHTIRPNQHKVYCGRECLKKTDEERRATKRKCRNEYRKNNREKVRGLARKWRESNKDKVADAKHRYYEKYKDRLAEKNKAYFAANSDKCKAKSRNYYQNNREVIRQKSKQWVRDNPKKVKERMERQREVNRAGVFLYSTKKSAREQGVSFDLTKEWVKERLDAGLCEMSGILFDLEGKRTPNSPSIDRIKVGGDYTQDNCRVIIWALNRALGNYGDKYMIEVFRAVIERKAIDPT